MVDVTTRRRVARAAEFRALAACACLVACGAPQALSHGALVLVEGAYVALHALPLVSLWAPSARGKGTTDVGLLDALPGARSFMDVFTTPAFFFGELVLYAVLYFGAPVTRAVLPAAFASHVVAHVVYTALSAAAPGWCVTQNVRRISVDAAGSGSALLVAWDASLNVLNALDAAMHVWYAALLSTCVVPRVAAPILFAVGVVITAAACWRYLQ